MKRYVFSQYFAGDHYQETRSYLSAKMYAWDRPCIYTRAGELRAPEIIRSQ